MSIMANINDGSNSKIAGCYNLGKTIGMGHFAVVKEAQHVFTQEKVAIKIIDKTKLDNEYKDQLLSEVMCMKLVQHPNIVRLYEVIDTPNKLYLVLELGDGGDLYDYIQSKGVNGMNENDAKHYFRQILRAVSYCHKLHVVHRDLKPENVVFFKQSELLKLTDFGFSNTFTPGENLKTSCGSLAYSAPEILLGDSYDAPKVDIWSLGVILYMLVVGSLPFNEQNDSETVARIMDCRFEIPSTVSKECSQLILKMIVKDFRYRASLDEIIIDDWLKLKDDTIEFQLENYTIPLITQQHLELEDHIELLTKMSDGNMAKVDEIQQILDNNVYNHISATYFLLAERKLKRKFVEEYRQLKAKYKCHNFATELQRTKTDTKPTQSKTIASKTRCISMILEDEESEENEENDAMTSLALVRQELELSMPRRGSDTKFSSGISPPHPSRNCSRFNSTSDLGNVFENFDADQHINKVSVSTRYRKNSSSNVRSFSSVSSQISTNNNVVLDYLMNDTDGVNSEIGGCKKYFTQIPQTIDHSQSYMKKSFSVIDISGSNQATSTHVKHEYNSCVFDNLPSHKYQIHKFFRRSKSINQNHFSNFVSPSSGFYNAAYDKGSILHTQQPVVFDTGSDYSSSPRAHQGINTTTNNIPVPMRTCSPTPSTATTSSCDSTPTAAGMLLGHQLSGNSSSGRSHKISTHSWDEYCSGSGVNWFLDVVPGVNAGVVGTSCVQPPNSGGGRNVSEPISEEGDNLDSSTTNRNENNPTNPPIKSPQHHTSKYGHDFFNDYCTRSKSFDSRYVYSLNAHTPSHMYHPYHGHHKPINSIVHKPSSQTRSVSERGKSNSVFSWDRVSINKQLQKSNNSLSSFVMKIQHSNVDQLIRGTYELRKSQTAVSNITTATFNTNHNNNKPSNQGRMPFSSLSSLVYEYYVQHHNSPIHSHPKLSTISSSPPTQSHLQYRSLSDINYQSKKPLHTKLSKNHTRHNYHLFHSLINFKKGRHSIKRNISRNHNSSTNNNVNNNNPKIKLKLLKRSISSDTKTKNNNNNQSKICVEHSYNWCHNDGDDNNHDQCDDNDHDDDADIDYEEGNTFCFSHNCISRSNNNKSNNNSIDKPRNLAQFKRDNLSCCVMS